LKYLSTIFLILILLFGCSNNVSTENSGTLEQSPTFKYPVTFGDGKKGEYILIGEKERVAFQVGSGEKGKSVVTPIVEGKTDKYMWYFWGNEKDLKGKLKVEGISENGKKMTLLTSSSLEIGISPIKGASSSLPSSMTFSTSGKCKLTIYIGDKLFGKIVIFVEKDH
jgi:hypothetical protein